MRDQASILILTKGSGEPWNSFIQGIDIMRFVFQLWLQWGSSVEIRKKVLKLEAERPVIQRRNDDGLNLGSVWLIHDTLRRQN